MMNHINNYPRANLNGATPYALAKLLIDEKLLEVLHFHKIRPDAVVMKPMLLHKPTYKNYPENSKKYGYEDSIKSNVLDGFEIRIADFIQEFTME